MQDKLAKMDKYKVWEIVDRQPGMRIVKARWVYTRKIDGNTGLPSSYKARWVAKRYSQIEGVDFNELFPAVCHDPKVAMSSDVYIRMTDGWSASNKLGDASATLLPYPYQSFHEHVSSIPSILDGE